MRLWRAAASAALKGKHAPLSSLPSASSGPNARAARARAAASSAFRVPAKQWMQCIQEHAMYLNQQTGCRRAIIVSNSSYIVVLASSLWFLQRASLHRGSTLNLPPPLPMRAPLGSATARSTGSVADGRQAREYATRSSITEARAARSFGAVTTIASKQQG